MSSGDKPPARIAWEIDRFSDVDLPVTVANEDGLWVLRFQRRFRDNDREFRVVFPADYPELGPLVYGTPGLLPRHQHAISGLLCLVDHEQNWWRPWRAAIELLRELDALLAATEQGIEHVRTGEAPIAEPISGYLSYCAGATILVPDALLSETLPATRGTFRLRRINDQLQLVAELYDESRTKIAGAEAAVLSLAQDQAALGGWVALAEPPSSDNFLPVLVAALREAADFRNTVNVATKAKHSRRRRRQPRMTGVTFLEEGPTQGERRRTWVFAETDGDTGWGDGPIRVQAISKDQRQERIPELVGLGDVRALMIGAGSLGAEVAVELAKTGLGRLDIIDPDVYEPGNAVRHVLPIAAAGQPKAPVLAEMCRSLNPFCDARGHQDTIGGLHGDPELIMRLFTEADVIVETTGSHATTRVLRRRAAAAGIPVVSAALSVGGYGGRVVVLRAGGPCFDCFVQGQQAQRIPYPDEGPRQDFTPFGCSHPAASCAGFDVAHLAAVTARLTVQALLRAPYPAAEHDWIVLNFRPGSTPVQAGSLDPDPDCPLPRH